MEVHPAKTESKPKRKTIMAITAPDLTQRPPRSPRVRLGGYVILPRMLDKGRAMLAGKNGEYHFDCPTDQQFLTFVAISAQALQEQLATGKGDGEILAWITANSAIKPSPYPIACWSAYQEKRVPTDVDSRDFFQEEHRKLASHREDIASWFDLLDLDDYISFGGKA